jgi:hypothetical protein
MASMLPTGWEAHCGRSLGLDAEWCELRLYIVSSSRFWYSWPRADIRSYDPEYEQWEFGKLSALREIALTIEGSYQYYYMGK